MLHSRDLPSQQHVLRPQARVFPLQLRYLSLLVSVCFLSIFHTLSSFYPVSLNLFMFFTCCFLLGHWFPAPLATRLRLGLGIAALRGWILTRLYERGVYHLRWYGLDDCWCVTGIRFVIWSFTQQSVLYNMIRQVLHLMIRAVI